MIEQAKADSILRNLDDNESKFTKLVEEIEKQTSFRLWSSGDYSDFENDVTYKDECKEHERYSFNLHFTINWENRSCYMYLGENLGDGWEDYHKVPVVYGQPLGDTIVEFLSKLKGEKPDDYYLGLTESYSDAFKTIVDEANQFSSFIGVN